MMNAAKLKCVCVTQMANTNTVTPPSMKQPHPKPNTVEVNRLHKVVHALSSTKVIGEYVYLTLGEPKSSTRFVPSTDGQHRRVTK